jgi:hypothetical protein
MDREVASGSDRIEVLILGYLSFKNGYTEGNHYAFPSALRRIVWAVKDVTWYEGS